MARAILIYRGNCRASRYFERGKYEVTGAAAAARWIRGRPWTWATERSIPASTMHVEIPILAHVELLDGAGLSLEPVQGLA
jgi:hypothetical protein